MKSRALTAAVQTKKDVASFRKAASAYTKKVTATKSAARKELITLGIYTRSGKLTKHYR
jgi:hypothetical protein